jgi:protein gp37
MSDLFHHDIPESFLTQVFSVMLAAHQHTFQILTKRPNHVVRFWRRQQALFGSKPIPDHIWIGTSIEDQRTIYRLAHLQRVPAAIRFLSCEPLLGPITLRLDGIHWVIVGGESGIAHRPMEIDWARAIRDQCSAAGIPFFFKQVGGRTPKAKGRMLDGRTWDEYPARTQIRRFETSSTRVT